MSNFSNFYLKEGMISFLNLKFEIFPSKGIFEIPRTAFHPWTKWKRFPKSEKISRYFCQKIAFLSAVIHFVAYFLVDQHSLNILLTSSPGFFQISSRRVRPATTLSATTTTTATRISIPRTRTTFRIRKSATKSPKLNRSRKLIKVTYCSSFSS